MKGTYRKMVIYGSTEEEIVAVAKQFDCESIHVNVIPDEYIYL